MRADCFDGQRIVDGQPPRWLAKLVLAGMCLLPISRLATDSSAAADVPPPPNVVLILADDLGYGDLGCYGQTLMETPNVDRLAREGTRFTQCYAGSSVCAPSRCTLMTGKHNGHGRVRDNLPHGVFLQPDDLTVAEVLQQAGYRTAAVGKWSLGEAGSWGVPNRQGFDEFFGYLSQVHAHIYYPQSLWRDGTQVLLPGNRGARREVYSHDLLTEEALRFIDENKNRPFFLYLAYTIPHWSDYDKDSPESLIVPSDAPYSDRAWPQVERNYAAMVSRLDRDVGRLLDRLRELGIDRQTAVFFTSDNGPSAEAAHQVEFFDSNGPLRGAKRDLYEGGIRVPMVVRWPGQVPEGRSSDHVWAFWDFLPTAAEMAGLPPQYGIDGVSVVPALLDRGEPPDHEFLYWDYGHTRREYQQAVRWKNWKAVRRGRVARALELYDLVADPGETQDVAGEHADLCRKISDLMAAATIESGDYRPASDHAP
jgi:arylsulfatase A-like enzyme